MDMGSHMFDLVILGVICLFFTPSHELTVQSKDLKSCKNNQWLCVTDLRDCDPRPPSSRLEALNMSCFYQPSWYLSLSGSLTCSWSREPGGHDDSASSLIFTTRTPVSYCNGIFNLGAILNVTVRIRDYMEETEIWSEPLTVDFYFTVKAFQPVLAAVNSTTDSLTVSWKSSGDGSCRLRYRINTTHTWTLAAGSVPVRRTETLVYRIPDLLPFSVYRAAVACRGKTGYWSDWSADATARTLERAPSAAPEVCYRPEKPDSGGSSVLHLMWKALDLLQAGGRVLGYQLSYAPTKKQPQQQNRAICNSTELTALLVVEERYYSVNISAFNGAGLGPAAQLSIDTQQQLTVPAVRKLWISTLLPVKRGLLVQWEVPPGPDPPTSPLAPPTASPLATPPVPPVSHFAIQWSSESDPSAGGWSRVDGFTSSAVIQDHLGPNQTYTVSVVPVLRELCGAPQSLSASLEHGAVLGAVRLKVVNVTKTTAMVVWAWQRTTEPTRVQRYRLMLRGDSEERALFVCPDQSEHTFHNLRPNTEYSGLLLADNITRETVPIKTAFDEFPAVVTATPLLLLAVTVLVVSILSRTVYKSYFFPRISSPHSSVTGQWLMDAHHQKTAERGVLDIEDFRVTDVLGKKHLIVGKPDSRLSADEDLNEDTPAPSLSHLIIESSALQLDSDYLSDPPTAGTAEQINTPPPRSCSPDYVVNFHLPDPVSVGEERKEETASLLPSQTADRHDPEKELDLGLADLSPTENIASFRESIVSRESGGGSPMTCETEYVLNSYFVQKPAGETSSEPADCPHIPCD